MLYLQIESPKSSVLNFLDSNSFEVIISIFKGQKRYRIWSVYEKLYAALFYTHIKVPVKPLNAVIQGLYGV